MNTAALAAPRYQFASPVAIRSLFYTLVLAAVAFLVLYPAVTLFMTSFQTNVFTQNPGVGLENWNEIFAKPRLVNAVINTISLASVRQLVGLIVGVLLSWLIARTNLPFSGWLEVGFWIALFMPALPVTLAWVLLAAENIGLLNMFVSYYWGWPADTFNVYSWWGIIWVHLMTATIAIKVFLLVPAFRAMDAALEDAARASGAPIFKTLLHIVVPIMMPTIIVVTLLGIIRSMQAFEIELILGSPVRIEVYTTAMYKAINAQPPGHGVASALAVMFLGVIAPLVALQQWYGARFTHASISGKFSNRIQDLGRWRWPLFYGIATMLFFMTVVPFVLLILSSFMKKFGMFDLPEPWTMRNWTEAMTRGDIPRAFWNSMRLAISASLVGMVVYSLLAYMVVKSGFYGRRILDFLTWLPAIIPGIVLSLGFLEMFAGSRIFRPLYGTIAVLVIAVVVGTLSLGTQIIKTSLVRLGAELEEASWASGASRFYTFRRIVLPLIAPSVAVIGLEVFAAGVSVVGLVALLGTGATQPLSIVQLIYLDGGLFEPASVIGLLIMTITVIAALLARHIGLKAGLGRAES